MRNEVKYIGYVQSGDDVLEGLYNLAERVGERERDAIRAALEVVWYFRDAGDADSEEEAWEITKVIARRAGLGWYLP